MLVNLIQNQRVVDISKLPPPPATVPDPGDFRTFAAWLHELTGKYGVKQKTVAEVTGKTPQSVTKWLKGGQIQAASLANIAEWTGVGYMSLRRLLDESMVGVLPDGVSDTQGIYSVRSATVVPPEFARAWEKLDPASRRQVLELAKLLARKKGR